MFGDFDFSKMNETDVRENILSVLIKELGYRHSTEASVITEQTLRYPKAYIGRKKANDPMLSGRADYILEYKGKWRWILEAKPGGSDISDDDREQAFSYAFHPEVKALYYAISNGKVFEVHLTNQAPGQAPLLSVNYENLESELGKLRNLLAPKSLERDWPNFSLDVGSPLADGLRSFVKINGGHIAHEKFTSSHLPEESIKHMQGIRVHIDNGVIQREKNGIIRAYVEFSQAFTPIQKAMEELGIKSLDLLSKGTTLSQDASNPTEFIGIQEFTIPAGHMLYDIPTGNSIPSPVSMKVSASNIVKAALSGSTIRGSFHGEMALIPSNLPPYEFPQIMTIIDGSFVAKLEH